MKELNRHDFSGSYASPNRCEYFTNETFSVGCFQWVKKANGKGLKKSAVKFRVKGPSSAPELVFNAAKEICSELDNGWAPTTKSMTVK